jgi:hypothetical protein
MYNSASDIYNQCVHCNIVTLQIFIVQCIILTGGQLDLYTCYAKCTHFLLPTRVTDQRLTSQTVRIVWEVVPGNEATLDITLSGN